MGPWATATSASFGPEVDDVLRLLCERGLAVTVVFRDGTTFGAVLGALRTECELGAVGHEAGGFFSVATPTSANAKGRFPRGTPSSPTHTPHRSADQRCLPHRSPETSTRRRCRSRNSSALQREQGSDPCCRTPGTASAGTPIPSSPCPLSTPRHPLRGIMG